MISLIKPSDAVRHHPVYDMLMQWSKEGCPIDCGEPWTIEHILAALHRGPHVSTKHRLAQEELHKETAAKVAEGFATGD